MIYSAVLGDGAVYVNENLTPFNKYLFWKAQKVRKELGYKYLYTQRSTVTLKKNEGMRPIQIRCEKDLPDK